MFLFFELFFNFLVMKQLRLIQINIIWSTQQKQQPGRDRQTRFHQDTLVFEISEIALSFIGIFPKLTGE